MALKNLLIYISPLRKFTGEMLTLVKIQIDNSLALGWDIKDLMLVTNFEFEYNGVKAIVVGGENFYVNRPRSLNTTVVSHLFDKGLIKDDTYWVHDFDAYQIAPITEAELGLDGFDAGFTDFGWRARWCMGSFFFKKGAEDIFRAIKGIVYKDVEDETAAMMMTENNFYDVNKRLKRMNITYNLGMRRVESNYKKADKPLKVIHFHAYYALVPTLDIFMYGKNGLNMPLMPQYLIDIFNKYNIK